MEWYDVCMSKIRVGVLRGGHSSEYDISLKTGAAVLRSLPSPYQGFDIFLAKDGIWHLSGVPTNPGLIFRTVDVVFNALHGAYGEDGKVQRFLEAHRVPYTGSTVLGSALSMHKQLAKEQFRKAGLRSPHGFVLHKGADEVLKQAQGVFRRVAPPWFVKPLSGGSSIGAMPAKNVQELVTALEQAYQHDDQVLVEEYVSGRPVSCGVMEGFRDQPLYVLLPYPGVLTKDESRALQEAARAAHQALGLRHYSLSDFVVSKRGVYLLETNALPELTPEAHFARSVEEVGTAYPQLLDHLISLALR